ncbi:autotransporter-associated beta strand protein [Elusimicrobium posterum]|uniref:autotransporter-associated beta strand repeat-containing protein n=1 Tax=Elusimicrobium posterum TaxID=3116653 RepID=UPI003C761D74
MRKRYFKSLFLSLFLHLAFLHPIFAACTDDGMGNVVCTDGSWQSAPATTYDTFTQSGPGETELNGQNTFDTSVNVDGGILSLESQQAAGGAYVLNLNGGTLKTSSDIDLSNEVFFNGGALDVQGEDIFLTLSGDLTGSSFTKNGEGVLLLEGSSSAYDGSATINEGVLITNTDTFQGNAILNGEESSLVFDQDTDGDFDGTVSGDGSFIKDGNSTITLTGAAALQNVDLDAGVLEISSSSNITGDVYLNNGELAVTESLELGSIQEQTIYLNSGQKGFNIDDGKTLTLGAQAKIAGGGCVDEGDCTALIKDGTGTLVLNQDTSDGRYFADTFINEGTLQISDGESLGYELYEVKIAGATLAVTDSTSIDNNINFSTTNSQIDIAAGKNVSLEGNTLGSGQFVKTGSGTLIMEGAMGHTGGTLISEGTLQGSASAFSGNIENNATLNFVQDSDGLLFATFSGSGTVNKSGAGILTLQGANTFTGNFNIEEGSVKGNTNSISFDVDAADGTSLIFNQNFDGEYSSVLSGAGSLVKTGSNTLTLSGVNTYSGGTYLQSDTRDDAGILITSDAALGTGNIFISNSNLTAGADITTSKDFILGSGVNSLSVEDGKTYTLNGIVSGTSFVKLGDGELVLNGDNTHSQGTQITEGTLSVSDEKNLGLGMLAITGGTFKNLTDMELTSDIYISAASGQGGFLVENGKTLTVNSVIYGGGTLNKKGAGTLLLDYYSTYTGGLNAEEGLVKGNTNSIVGNITVAAGAEVEFNQDFSGYFLGDISSSGTITKTGEGIVLAQANSEENNLLSVGTLNVKEGGFIAESDFLGNAYISDGAFLSLAAHGEGNFETEGTLYVESDNDINVTGNITVKNGGVLSLFLEEGTTKTLNVKDTTSLISEGNITIEDGGKIEINATGTFASAHTIDFLNYEGIFSGDINNFDVVVGNNSRLQAEMQDSGSTLSFIISRILTNYSTLNGLKYNQRQTAAAIDKVSAAPSADFEALLDIIDLYQDTQKGSAITQLGGFIYANMPNSFSRFKDNAYLRINNVPSEDNEFGKNIWAQSVSNYADISANENSEDLYNFSAGFAVGLDKYYENAAITLGFFGGYARHDLKHNKKENMDGDEYQLGLYLLKKTESFDFKAAAALSYQAADVERDLSLFGRRANSRIKSYGANLDFELGLSALRFNTLSLRPFAGVSGGVLNRSSFTEKGADSADLSFDGDTVFSAEGRAGIGLHKNAKTFALYFDVLAKQPLADYKTTLMLSGQEYEIDSADIGTMFGVNLGGVKNLSAALSVYADAGADLNSTAKNYYLNIGLRTYW